MPLQAELARESKVDIKLKVNKVRGALVINREGSIGVMISAMEPAPRYMRILPDVHRGPGCSVPESPGELGPGASTWECTCLGHGRC